MIVDDAVLVADAAPQEPLGMSLMVIPTNTVTLQLSNGAHHFDCFSIHDLNGTQIMIPHSMGSKMKMNRMHSSSLSMTTPMQSNSYGKKVNLEVD
jgi:hypothetical protein